MRVTPEMSMTLSDTQNPPEIDRKMLIEGLGRGLRVIEAFSDDRPRMTATEAGLAAALTRTAARRTRLKAGR